MNFEYQDTLNGSIEGSMVLTCMVGMTNVCGSSCTDDTEATIEPIPQPLG